MTSLALALKTDTPRLGQLIKANGEAEVLKYVKRKLVELNDILNLSKPLSIPQILFISDVIITEYRNLSVADLHVIFSTASKGGYGDFYGQLNPPKILQWFVNYQSDRQDLSGQMSYQAHAQIKENPSESRNSEMTVKDFLKRGL